MIGKRGLNPADQFRKIKKKQEIKKGKEKEAALRETRDLLDNPEKIEQEIQKVQSEWDSSKLDKSLKDRVAELKMMKAVALKKQKIKGATGAPPSTALASSQPPPLQIPAYPYGPMMPAPFAYPGFYGLPMGMGAPPPPPPPPPPYPLMYNGQNGVPPPPPRAALPRGQPSAGRSFGGPYRGYDYNGRKAGGGVVGGRGRGGHGGRGGDTVDPLDPSGEGYTERFGSKTRRPPQQQPQQLEPQHSEVVRGGTMASEVKEEQKREQGPEEASGGCAVEAEALTENSDKWSAWATTGYGDEEQHDQDQDRNGEEEQDQDEVEREDQDDQGEYEHLVGEDAVVDEKEQEEYEEVSAASVPVDSAPSAYSMPLTFAYALPSAEEIMRRRFTVQDDACPGPGPAPQSASSDGLADDDEPIKVLKRQRESDSEEAGIVTSGLSVLGTYASDDDDEVEDEPECAAGEAEVSEVIEDRVEVDGPRQGPAARPLKLVLPTSLIPAAARNRAKPKPTNPDDGQPPSKQPRLVSDQFADDDNDEMSAFFGEISKQGPETNELVV